MSRVSAAVILLLACTFWCAEAQAIGIIVSVPRSGKMRKAQVGEAHLEIAIDNQVARTEVTEVFVNPYGTQLEGDFIFPLPAGANVTDFSFWMNGREAGGDLLDSDEARDIYTEIVSRVKDPALLEYVGSGMLRLRIFPIPACGSARVKLAYTQVLRSAHGVVTYRYPVSTAKYSAGEVGKVSVKLDIASKSAIKSVYCPTHEVKISRDGDHGAQVAYEAENVRAARDFALHWTTDEKDFGLNFITWREKGDDGYFLALLSPGQELSDTEVLPRDIVFVLDTSGSMEGKKLVQAKRALKSCVRRLDERDRFNIVQFASGSREFAESPATAGKENVGKACEWIDAMVARGASNVEEALYKALSHEREPGRTSMVIFMTDGQPTYGEKDLAKLLDYVREINGGSFVFVFGIGYDVNTAFLDRLAQQNGGTREYIERTEDIEPTVSAFFEKISDPVLAYLQLEFEGLETYGVHPQLPGQVFRGDQVVLAGRYRGEGRKTIKLSGRTGTAMKEYEYRVDFPAESDEAAYLPCVWATSRVGYLLGEIRFRGLTHDRMREVVGLARDFGILTPYTSYLVVEDERLGRPLMAESMPTRGLEEALRSDRPALARLQAQIRTDVGREAIAGSRFAMSMLENAGEVRIRELMIERNFFRATCSGPAKPGGYGAPEARQREIEDVGDKIAAMVKRAGSKTFYLNKGVWTDSLHRGGMEVEEIAYLSAEYFDLLRKHPEAGKYLAMAEQVLVVLDGRAYRVVKE